MILRPVTLAEAKGFVREHHRHAQDPPPSWRFGVGVENGGEELVGVAMAGRPVASALDDGRTLEVTRVCTLGDRNACSMLYAAILRAGRALGYRRAVTYTIEGEPGSSLKVVGFRPVETRDRGGDSWDTPARPRQVVERSLFGDRERRTYAARTRWEVEL